MPLVRGESKGTRVRSRHDAALFQRRDLIEVDEFVVEGDDLDERGQFIECLDVIGRTDHHGVGGGDGRIFQRGREHGQRDVGVASRLAHHAGQLARSHHPY